MDSSDFMSGSLQQRNDNPTISGTETWGGSFVNIVGEERQGENASRFDLEKVFLWHDDTSSYINKGNFEEAFGILDERNRLGEDLRDASFLLEYCVSLMATESDYEQAKEQLKTLMKSLNPLSKAVLWLADKLCQLGRFYASLLVYEIFYDLFYEAGGSYVVLEAIENCVVGMKQTVTIMLENDENLNPFVTRCVLPQMYAMKDAFSQICDVNPQYKCVKYAWVIHGIEICETNRRKRIRLVEDTLTHMRDVLGDSAVLKHQIFGTLANNLGSAYLRQGSNEQAVAHLAEALNCFNIATDFQSDSKREKYIKDTERVLSRAQGLE